MELQYVSDVNGHHTAVIIPIEEWNNIKSKYKDLIVMEKSKFKPSDFKGSISKKTAKKMILDIEKSRTEWERTF